MGIEKLCNSIVAELSTREMNGHLCLPTFEAWAREKLQKIEDSGEIEETNAEEEPASVKKQASSKTQKKQSPRAGGKPGSLQIFWGESLVSALARTIFPARATRIK